MLKLSTLHHQEPRYSLIQIVWPIWILFLFITTVSSENYFISQQLETGLDGLAGVMIKDMNMGIAPGLQKLSQCESAPECDSCVCKSTSGAMKVYRKMTLP